jgi:8-oxo-dGTP pyrophosphatase MutT (NUDIX family)
MSKERPPVLEGMWGEQANWELFETSELPPRELCTSVFVVPVMENGKIVLMHDVDRGLGLIGGHIDPGETIEITLGREAQGEAGIEPEKPKLFAAKRIIAHQQIPHQDPSKEYPFPISHMVYYVSGVKDNKIGQHTEDDSLGGQAFALEEIEQLGIGDYPIIKLGIDARRREIDQKL